MWYNADRIIFVWLLCVQSMITAHDQDTCHLPNHLIQEIDSYAPIVHRIINESMQGSFKGTTWQDLATFVDKFGPRFTGTQVLEDAIDYVLNKSISLGLDNVHGEPATVPRWVRGSESATLLQPRQKNLALLGLGYSIGTPKKGITANAVVVNSFAELKKRAEEIPGKIVVYNQKFVSYGETVEYRSVGAIRAAELGAVAALIRSVTPFSLYTPHTGMMNYAENVTKIPAACITVEDATLLGRMADRGETIIINLKMEAKRYPDTQSRNVIADIIGSSVPAKAVVVSGHIDSWDVGIGAMDDGGGIFISWNALKLLKHLGIRARRTIRMIMWTAEEFGLLGAEQYIRNHAAENGNLQFVMESDSGTFTPTGLEVSGNKMTQCILQRIMRLLTPLGDMKLKSPCTGPDISFWIKAGVPGGALLNRNEKYFYYHHTNADTMLAENPKALDMNTALFAAVSFVLADISVDLPQHNFTSIVDFIAIFEDSMAVNLKCTLIHKYNPIQWHDIPKSGQGLLLIRMPVACTQVVHRDIRDLQFNAGSKRQFLRDFLDNRYSWWFARPPKRNYERVKNSLNLPEIEPEISGIAVSCATYYATLVLIHKSHRQYRGQYWLMRTRHHMPPEPYEIRLENKSPDQFLPHHIWNACVDLCRSK